jgi:hypothetical protein
VNSDDEAMMPDLRFDPSKAVTFDLTHGLVHLEGAPSRVLVPAEALLALAAAAGAEATAAFARTLGAAMGRRVSARLAEPSVSGAAVEVVVEHLGGELALAGLGSLGLERWGRAAVLVVDQSPLGGAGDALLEGVLASAVEAAAGRSVRALRLGRDGVRARFLLGGSRGLEKVRGWLAEGVPWGEALVRLHVPAEVSYDGSAAAGPPGDGSTTRGDA